MESCGDTYNEQSTVSDMVNNPLFKDFGHLLFPVDRNVPLPMTLAQVSMPNVYMWYPYIQVDSNDGIAPWHTMHTRHQRLSSMDSHGIPCLRRLGRRRYPFLGSQHDHLRQLRPHPRPLRLNQDCQEALFRYASLFAVLGGVEAEGTEDVAAEIGRRREVEHVRDLDKGQGLVPQQTGYVERGVTVDPVVGRISADRLRDLRQVFGRNAQGVGIIRHLAVITVVAVLQHIQETVHQQ